MATTQSTTEPPLLGSLHSAFLSRDRLPLYASLKDGDWFADDPPPQQSLFRRCIDWILGLGPWVYSMGQSLWQFGRSDPRKVIFAGKAGLALAIISVLVFVDDDKFFSEDLAKHYVWAILTVVVVFEFSVGATLSKGLNRGLGTLTAGGLALGVAELSTLMGNFEEVFLVTSIFTAGFITTYLKLYPSLKAYEYGFRVFLITFCYVMVSGYRTNQFVETATSRFLLIVLGAAVGYGVNILIYPIWAGEDLHELVVKNFLGVAKSLEGCVNGYLQCFEYERIPSKILTYQAHEDHLYSGYRSAVQSTSQEDSLAPAEFRQIFGPELQKVGTEGAKVLRELGNKVKGLTRLTSADILADVHLAAEVLQRKIDQKSYLLVNYENWEVNNNKQSEGGVVKEDLNGGLNRLSSLKSLKGSMLNTSCSRFDSSSTMEKIYRTQTSWPARRSFHPSDALLNEEESKTYESASALSLATFASLLIEFVARLQNIVNAFEELSEKANFKETVIEPGVQTELGFWARVFRLVGLKR